MCNIPPTHTHMQRYVFQDLRSKVMGGLDRPKSMQKDGFVPKDIQCPQKPRGRKKSKVPKEQDPEPPKGRPSAAACGFSTVGMTDEEVQKKLQALKLVPADDTGYTQPKRARSKGEKVLKETGSEGQDAEIKIKKAKKGSKVDEKEGSSANDLEQEEAKHVKKRERKVKRSHETKADQPDKKPRKTSAKGDVPNRTPLESKASGSADKVLGGKERKDKGKKGKANEERAATANTEGERTDAEKATAARKAEAKARVSRKSSAYHAAVRAAKQAGKSKEEQVAAGKSVPCLIE